MAKLSDWLSQDRGRSRRILGTIVLCSSVGVAASASGMEARGSRLQSEGQESSQENNAEALFERGDRYYKQWLERYPGGHTDHNPRLLSEAVQSLEGAAERGSAAAQFYLGYIWFEGHGRQPDYKQSLQWFEMSAQQGDADATVYLALQYAWGWGVRKDSRRARELFQRVEEIKPRSSWAIGALAAAYFEGRGVKKDLGKAAYWYEKNARTGDVLAQYRLGQILKDGKGVPKDLVGAYFWLSIAAENEAPDPGTAGPNRARWMVSPEEWKRRVVKGMTAEQIAEAERLLEEWRRQP